MSALPLPRGHLSGLQALMDAVQQRSSTVAQSYADSEAALPGQRQAQYDELGTQIDPDTYNMLVYGAGWKDLQPGSFASGIGSLLDNTGKARFALEAETYKRQNAMRKAMVDDTEQDLARNDPLTHLSKMRGLGASSQGIVMLPNGNQALKAGDRFYEVVPDSDAPEGYRMKEIVSAGKTILGADTSEGIIAKQLTKELEEKDFSHAPDPSAARDEWLRTRREELRRQLISGVAKSPIVTMPPSPVVQGAKGQAAPGGVALKGDDLYAHMDALSALVDQREKASGGDRLTTNDQMVGLRRTIKAKFGFDPLTDPIPEQYLNAKRQDGAPVVAQATEAPLKDSVEEARKKEYGAKQGASLEKEYTNIRNAGESAMRFDQTMALLGELLDSGEDIASGPAAEKFNMVKSFMQSIGIPVGPSAGIEDVFKSFSTESALKARTAGGENLLPGAMSNYEDQLLRSMMPGLMQSREGRRALVDMMREVSRTNVRFMEEANKLASGNKNNMLTPEWQQRSQRVMKEEMARLALRRREIMSKYGVK